MCARRPTDQRDAQTISLLWTSLLLFHGGDVTCFDVSCLQVKWSNVVACEVMWGELLWLVATWHGMSCHVSWCGGHVIWCGVIACVVSCHVMECDVMVMSCCLLCPAMGWNVMSLECHWLWGHVVVRRCSKWFCDDVVIQSTTLYYKVRLCTTKYYSGTTLHRVLLQYYSVLQSTTPVLLCTEYYSNTNSVLQSTTYYSITTLCYKVLQYYSVLQSTPVQYYSVLLRYYSVLVLYQNYTGLQSATQILICTTNTEYDKVALMIDPWHMNRYLHCAGQQESSSNFAKYCACHEKWLSWPMIDPHHIWNVTWNVSLQLQQILHLPRKMNLMTHDWSASQMKQSFTISGATGVILQLHQILRLPRNMTLMTHDWSASHMKRHLQCAEQVKSPFKLTKECACRVKIWARNPWIASANIKTIRWHSEDNLWR